MTRIYDEREDSLPWYEGRWMGVLVTVIALLLVAAVVMHG